ncbi:MAG: hypothetical protein N2690_12220, partial [Rhodocyclaceae bacterium]|nr:hypothetical protein [Rhodocyclaceae bacterium]
MGAHAGAYDDAAAFDFASLTELQQERAIVESLYRVDRVENVMLQGSRNALRQLMHKAGAPDCLLMRNIAQRKRIENLSAKIRADQGDVQA